MKKTTSLLASLLISGIAFGQCNLDFQDGSLPQQFTFVNTSGSDIVNGGSSGANALDSQSFDIWDEANDDCTTGGGLDDITFDFEILETFDQYSIDGIIDLYGGSTHEIDQSGSGLTGRLLLGSTSTNETTAGDVRGYKITVTFADHVYLQAQDVTVELTSVNTSASAHESCSIVFFDETGTDYGTATYDGYYNGTTGPSIDNTCTVPTVRANSWSSTGTGVYTASSTSTTDVSVNGCNPTSGSNGGANNGNVRAVEDAGLSSTDRVGGFTFIVYLEDVAASSASGAETSTSSSLTSTLNGILISSNPLPVEITTFDTQIKNEKVALNWSTASEESNDHFDIEWSIDGERFESIGLVQGQGTSFEMTDYIFIHDSPAVGNNYYRLKQVDYNGKFTFSEIRIANIKNTEKISLFPSMAEHEINIRKPDWNSSIGIYSINGTLVRQINNNREQELQININDLPKGNYFISVQTDNQFYTEKFIKL